MMGKVAKYQTATVEIHFPEGAVCCNNCPLLEFFSRNRAQCRRTGEYLIDTSTIGFDCPLDFKEEANAE